MPGNAACANSGCPKPQLSDNAPNTTAFVAASTALPTPPATSAAVAPPAKLPTVQFVLASKRGKLPFVPPANLSYNRSNSSLTRGQLAKVVATTLHINLEGCCFAET
jgi:hypothetical protein